MPEESTLAAHDHERGEFRPCPGGLEWSGQYETLWIQAWGTDAVRVRAKVGGPVLTDLPGALLAPAGPAQPPTVHIDQSGARLVRGGLTVTVSSTGRLAFTRTDDGSVLLAEQDAHFWWPGPRLRTAQGNGYHRLEQ